MRDELSFYFWSRKNQAGMLGAIVGVGLFAGGVVSGGLVPVVAVGLYGAGALLMPNRKTDQLLLDDNSDTRVVQRDLDRLVITAREKLEADLTRWVEHIEGTVDEIFKRSKDSGSASSDSIYIVRRCASNYLPLAVNQYLALPADYRLNYRGLKNDQNTPHDDLEEQLKIMDEKMTEVLNAILAGDASALRQRGEFLKRTFNVGSDEHAMTAEN